MAKRRTKSGTMAKAGSVIDRARVIRYLQQRYNPLVSLTPESLKRQHAQFDAGFLREFALTMEHIKGVDDILKNVTGKREKAPPTRGWEIMKYEDSPEAEKHQQCLEYLYNNLTCTNAIDENERGGMRLLLRQMMYAVGYKYTAHEITWEPSAAGITATVRYVPLWFFENTTGNLRFLESDGSMYGVELEEAGWLITVGEFLMRTCSIAYLYKHMPLRDWLIYCGRHGMPGIAGKTSAAADSAEWKKMEEAVQDFASEFAAVMSKEDTIEAIDLTAKGELPWPKLVERMDRMMSALWRGADLSTMSSGQGEGTGASLQGEEKEVLEADDAAMLSEALQEYVDRYAILYHLGDEEPLAYIQIKTSTKKNVDQDLKVDETLQRMGFPITAQSLSDRYNRPLPDEKEIVIEPRQQAAPGQPFVAPARPAASNAAVPGQDVDSVGILLGAAREQLADAEQKVLAPLAAEINDLIRLADAKDVSDEEYQAMVLKFRDKQLPEMLTQMNAKPETIGVLVKLFSAEFVNGIDEGAMATEVGA